MIIRYSAAGLASAILLLAGCAQPVQQQHLQAEVSQLASQLQTLTDRATALKYQNDLNSQSTSGVWLLPAARNRALVQSEPGQLSLSLSHIESEANGTRALLHIRSVDPGTLPALTAQVAWGQLDPVTGKPLTRDMQMQTIHTELTLLPKSDATVELRLSEIAPEQLGFVRISHIQAQNLSGDAAAK
ncbi:DUF3251 domain-containing protein [Affinibrenneria salicis]|uniref:DUF3251 domain-containing protein n=1 Tax=Affinibrenneria salicis TaxID=2590031 RepID=A0A5J5G174_9GAMM|nr:DUF3251 domain-containing protein [Affinibrenneria salicis]KAA9000094.1 DUF3251 domain-containing protein [Affinibrenneria salicis]